MSAASPIYVVIPARDAHQSLPRVLSELPTTLFSNIIVVDDGSARALEVPGVRLLRHPTPRGPGGAQKTGYAAALEAGAGRVVLLPGDGRHDTAQTLALAELVGATGADAALGACAPEELPAWRRRGRQVLTTLTNRRFQAHLSAPLPGARAFHADVLRVLPLARFSDGDLFDQELLAGLLARGLNIAEAPVSVQQDPPLPLREALPRGLACLRVLAWPPG